MCIFDKPSLVHAVCNAIIYVEVHYDAVNSREVLFDDVTYVSRCYDAITSNQLHLQLCPDVYELPGDATFRKRAEDMPNEL